MLSKLLDLFYRIVLILTLIVLFPVNLVQATTYFSDNFEDGDISDWTPTNNSCGSQWKINEKDENKRLGIVISGNCFTEIAPNSWNPAIVDYLLEVDMDFVSGTDKNLAFRFTDHSSWYDLHFITGSRSTDIVLQRVYNSNIYNNRVQVPGMVNGRTYHISVEILGEHIKIFVDNDLVLDYPDAGGRFPTGKIALQASAGGDPHSEVYFDNVVVSSIEQPADPVVVIPGLMGSWCKQAITGGGDCPGSWTALPEPLDPYDSLVSSIINAADIPDNDVFVWYYDWRKQIADLAGQLNSYINSTVLSGKPSGTKVRLVGHSYGGLVAAKYSQDHSDKTAKLITVGSPHRGAVMAYGAWEGGEVWDFPVWERIPLQLLLTARAGLFQTPKDVIRNDFKSAQQILPTFDYLTNQSNQTISESSMSQRNPQLPNQYSGLSSIKSLLTTITGLENSSQNTLSSVKVNPRNWMEQALGLWEDGKPTQFTRSTVGDLTVLKTSGRYDQAASIPEVSATHVSLVSETAGINAVLQSLGSSATAQITDVVMNDDNGQIVFFLRSPATMSIQFNGQNYADPDADGLIVIENATAGDAEATLTGTDNGAYHLDVLQFHPNGDKSDTYSGSISNGEIQTFSFKLDPGSPPTPLQDSDGWKNLDIAVSLIDEMQKILNNADGRIRAKNQLLSQLNSTRQLLNLAKTGLGRPLTSLGKVQSALLIVHRFRSTLDLNESNRFISSSDAVKLRKLSLDLIDRLQNAFSILSARANRNYSSKQLAAADSLADSLTNKVDQKANTAVSGLTIAAGAYQSALDDHLEADEAVSTNSPQSYVNYLSARMYLEEALQIIR